MRAGLDAALLPNYASGVRRALLSPPAESLNKPNTGYPLSPLPVMNHVPAVALELDDGGRVDGSVRTVVIAQ